MPAFSYLKLTDRLACQGMQAAYGVLRADELDGDSEVRAVEEQESFTFSYHRLDAMGSVRPITAQMRAGRVITPVMEDGSIEREWRVGTVTPPGRGSRGLITVQCVPLWLDLVERADSSTGKGWVSDVSAGVRNFDYELTEKTPAQIWASDVIPNCPSWVTAGTIDPTYVIPSLSVSRQTPGALAIAVRDALRNVDVPCELQLRMNGTTDYKLDLVTQIGASANTPVFHPNNALLSLEQKSDPTLQATRLLMRGGNTPDGLPGIWGRARFRGGAPSGNVIALTDRNGGTSPIGFDNQFVGTYLLRVKTGRTFLITASSAAGGTVTLASVSTIAADEDFEFRLTEPLNNTRTTTTRYAVSAVPDGTHITCGVSAPITVTNQYVDWYAKVWSLAVGGTVIITTRISASVSATDVLTVASSAGVTNAHYVEFVQLDGAGEVPCFIDHPTYIQPDPVGYGVKVMELSKPMLGVTQLIPNAWMRQWSNSANPPDGWSIGFAPNAPGMRQNTNTSFTRYGGLSWRSTGRIGGIVYGNQQFVTPTFYHQTSPSDTSVSVRAYFYVDSAESTIDLQATLSVYALKGDGTFGTLLASGMVGAPETYGVGDAPVVATGTWIEIKTRLIGAISPSGDPASAMATPFGMKAQLTMTAAGFGGGTTFWDAYLDGIEAYAFGDCPSEPFEFGDASSLLQAGNNQHRLTASPPQFYTIGILDLERIMPDEYARLAQTLGANVRAVDPEYGTDVTVRLLTRRRSLLDASKTQLTLANRPTLLSNLQSTNTATQRRVIDAVNAGSSAATSAGPAFVALTANAALTSDAEIATPSGGSAVVTLPAADPTADTGSSVTYVPPDPTTTPTVVVTAGKPPSRRKPIPIY